MSEGLTGDHSRSDNMFSRRKFLQLAGLFSLMAVSPCSDRLKEGAATKNFYDSILQSLLSEASAKRNWQFADEELNHGRVNILFFSFGELYEPSERQKLVTIGSPTVVSLSSETIDLISVTHEIRSPEVERYLQSQGQFDGYAKTIDQAYFKGGFELLRTAVESATGLSVDFQVAFNETVIADAIDKLYGRVEIDVPLGFNAYPFYFKGKWYPVDHFSTGKEMMSGTRAIQFMKTIPDEKVYNQAFENTTRKHALLESLKRTLESSSRGLPFWLQASSLLYQEIKNEDLAYDVNLGSLMLNMFGSLARNSSYSFTIPKIGAELYVSDPANSNFADGLGGMQWIASSQNPIFQKELESGFYPGRAIKVPFDSTTLFEANPHADDLVTDYWRPIRTRVKQSLLRI